MKNSMSEEKKFYKLGDVSEMLGVTRETVRLWINSGKLTASLVDRTYIIQPDDFDAFINDHKVKNND
jgi:excisionase family DNA binding protein|tara:strand:+ start:3094 stop:3294 length:201 start_codon:yes stop_codon:yes gene_type:complete